MKTKIKSYGGETTNVHNKEMPKVASNRACLAIITIDCALKKDEKYYPRAFLKECKDVEKEKKVIRHVTESIEIFSSDSDEE